MKAKEIKIFDIPDEILEKCILIPEEGIKVGKTNYVAAPISRKNKAFAIKTYSDPYSSKKRSSTTFITASGETYVTKGDWIIPYLKEVGYTQGTYYDIFVPNEEPDLSDLRSKTICLNDSWKIFCEREAENFFKGDQTFETFRVMRENIDPSIEADIYVENKRGELCSISSKIWKMIADGKLCDSPFFGKIKAIEFKSSYGTAMCKKERQNN